VLLLQLGRLNMLLLVFNLMPAHPLDGGRALAHLVSAFIGYDRAMRLVAYLGMLVAVWLVWLGFSGSYFAFLIAFVLFQANMQVLRVHGGGPRWRRWN
jgi:Zn-dependent protease